MAHTDCIDLYWNASMLSACWSVRRRIKIAVDTTRTDDVLVVSSITIQVSSAMNLHSSFRLIFSIEFAKNTHHWLTPLSFVGYICTNTLHNLHRYDLII